MSEIAKCPLCGNSQVETLNEYTTPSGAYCCGVRCDSFEKWNQYAAAMEYAKKTAYWFSLPDGVKHPDDARAEKAMTDAETRVLEVFK